MDDNRHSSDDLALSMGNAHGATCATTRAATTAATTAATRAAIRARCIVGAGLVAMLSACGSVRGTDKPLLQEPAEVTAGQPSSTDALKPS